MPQDHASWDRKELSRQRKHDRPPPEQSFDSGFRWRDSPTNNNPNSHREFSRWGGSAADFRRPYGKQGGRNQFVEEPSHGYSSSRSNARMFENDYYRPPASRGDWRYPRNFRDDRVPVNQKDWKCNNTWGEMSNGSSRDFERPGSVRNGRRSIDERPVNGWDPVNSTHQPDIEICAPIRTPKFKNEQKFPEQRNPDSAVGLFDRPSSENGYGKKACSPPAKQCNELMYGRKLASDNSLDPPILNAKIEGTSEQLHLQDDRLHENGDVDGARKNGKESSLGAIPIWTRTESFASQTSGHSHSSSLKSLGTVDSNDRKNEGLPKTVSVAQSSLGDATAIATTNNDLEEMRSNKKQRLGWGEGLAKYEKKKVDVNTNEDGTSLLENGTEEVPLMSKEEVADKSPTAAAVPDYGSPTTPSSVACSSSPVSAEKSPVKAAAIVASDVSNMCRSPSPVSSIQLERFPINIEELDNIPMERFGSLIDELLGSDDPGTWVSSSVQSKSLNRLLGWKNDILKAVEMTESEIDLLENKHKTLKLEGGGHNHSVVGDENMPKEQEASCILDPKAAAETLVRDNVHQAVLSKVPVDVFEDSLGEGKSLTLSSVAVEANEDMFPVLSIKADASSSHEIVELSSADDSMVSNEDLLCAKLLSSNKKYASESYEVLNELLPRDSSLLVNSKLPGTSQSPFDGHVKEKIADKVELLRAREKILLLKFKAFQLLWKKDLKQLASTKYQSKHDKKTELYPNSKNGGHLKLPQPVRLRFSSAPRRDSVPPMRELVSYMEKLLPHTHLKPFRDTLRMPAMILDEKERVMSRFISSNGLIEDPCDVEKERAMINPWTSEEKETFLSMLAMHGKNFKKIASYLTQKTTADCVDYYYKNHKSDSFGKIKKQRKEGKHTYMLAPRKKWNREMGAAASLDILGAVSVIAANAGKVASTRQISSKRISLRGCSSSNSFQQDGNNSEGCSNNLEFPRKRTLGAGVSSAVGPLSSEQMNPCLRTSMNSSERCTEHLKVDDPVVKKPRLSDSMQNENSNEEDDTCSEESYGETGPIHWTDDERAAFIQGFSLFGKNFASISRFVRTRSEDQCRVFFSKVRKCLGLECIQSGSGNVSTSASVDNAIEVVGTGLEEPCAVESNSGKCNGNVNQEGANRLSSANIGLNSPTSSLNMYQEGAKLESDVKPGLSRSEQENGITNLDISLEPSRDVVDINTVVESSQCETAAEKPKSKNDLLSMEIDEGNLTSVAVSSDPLYCSSSVLSNISLAMTPSETPPRKRSGGGVALFRQSSKNQYNLMQVSNSTKFPECLHHVPIEVYREDVSASSENKKLRVLRLPSPSSGYGAPICHTEFELPIPLVQTSNLGWNLDLNGKLLQGFSHVKPEQNGHQIKAINIEPYQVPSWRSFTQDPNRISRSTSDLVMKTHRTGESFSLSKCTTSATKPLTVIHKDERSGHSRSHSFSLPGTTSERVDNNGDVKLFGTVLTTDENGSKQKQSMRDHETRHEYINQQHLQNVPITSYGFWDGNRIRTGLTYLPESAKLLASCPEAAFTTQVMSSSSNTEVQLDVSSGGVLSFGKKHHIEAEATSVSSGKGESNKNIDGGMMKSFLGS